MSHLEKKLTSVEERQRYIQVVHLRDYAQQRLGKLKPPTTHETRLTEGNSDKYHKKVDEPVFEL